MEPPRKRKYTCKEYGEEMRLLGLKRRLEQESLSEVERRRVEEEIARLERAMAMS
ncbi:MAG: hypothetical protein HZB55_21480 [Deltaproteobacteria bacterium]|nr:hypothetical protein [Deltaproteobacteria bacterium]